MERKLSLHTDSSTKHLHNVKFKAELKMKHVLLFKVVKEMCHSLGILYTVVSDNRCRRRFLLGEGRKWITFVQQFELRVIG